MWHLLAVAGVRPATVVHKEGALPKSQLGVSCCCMCPRGRACFPERYNAMLKQNAGQVTRFEVAME